MAEININGNVIDSPTAEHTYRDASSSEFIYVNSNGDMNLDQKRELLGLGVHIQEYVSDHTYLCHYKGTNLDSIRQLSYVRAVNVLEPALKTDASLKSLIASDTGKTEFKVEVEIHWESPQTLDQVAEEISRRTGVALDQMKVGSGRIELTVPRDKIAEIESIDSVNHIEEWHPVSTHNPYARGVLAQDWDYTAWGNWKNYANFKGRNEIVVVMDTGVDMKHRVFKDKIVSNYCFCKDQDGKLYDKDVNGHGTHCAGSVVEGAATKCKIIPVCQWDPQSGGFFTPPDYTYYFTDPYDRYGARIHTNSWGHSWNSTYEPVQKEQLGYDITAGLVDGIVRKRTDYVIVFSAGNSGGWNNWKGELACQNGAKNVITVGNSVSLRPNDNSIYNPWCVSPDAKRMCASSSSGPTLAEGGNRVGRIKPDVVAPGTAMLSALSRDKPREEVEKTESYNGGKYWDPDYCWLSGTSMSTPHVAGCCAVIREALRAKEWGNMQRPSASLVKALLINGTVDLKGHRFKSPQAESNATNPDTDNFIGPAPNSVQGFGRVDLSNSLMNAIDGCVEKQTPGFGYVDAGDDNPEFWPRSLSIKQEWWSERIYAAHKVIKVTLVYPDPPGKGTQNAVVLSVGCGGQVRWGNCGDGPGYDIINNVQKVVWENPPGETYQIRVKVMNIAAPFDENGNELKQSFACAWMTHN